MSVVLDAGALIALERGDAASWERVKIEVAGGRTPRTHGGVVAQVWRGGRDSHALLSRALRHLEVRPLDDGLGRRAGMLLAHSGGSDAIDAAVVALAVDGDVILTSDPGDLDDLASAADLDLVIIPT